MKVKYLSFVEVAVLIIAFPFELVIHLVFLPFTWVTRLDIWINTHTKYWKFKVGNCLLRHSFEATHGMIKNKSILRNWTAYDAYQKLKLWVK